MADSTQMPLKKLEIEAIMLRYKKSRARYKRNSHEKMPDNGKVQKITGTARNPGFQSHSLVGQPVAN
jgi:hypothetical protein